MVLSSLENFKSNLCTRLFRGGLAINYTKLTLKNMIFYGHHGVDLAEQDLGQRIEVDLELRADLLAAGQTDRLAATINYVDLYDLTKAIVETERYHLIEAIAVRLVDQIMADYHIEQVTVRVRKPQAPVGGLVETVEFEVSKERGNL